MQRQQLLLSPPVAACSFMTDQYADSYVKGSCPRLRALCAPGLRPERRSQQTDQPGTPRGTTHANTHTHTHTQHSNDVSTIKQYRAESTTHLDPLEQVHEVHSVRSDTAETA